MEQQASSLANLRPPWRPGQKVARRSGMVDRALRKARNLTPEAIDECAKRMRESLDERVRLKAAEIILLHGMPKGAVQLDGEHVTGITITIEHTQAPVTQSDPVPASGPVITIDTLPAGSGDD